MNPVQQVVVKIMLVGDYQVGKTSFLTRFHDGIFTEDICPTIGLDFVAKILEVDGKKVKLSIWDSAGQEQYRSLLTQYYKVQKGIIFFFDITNRGSYLNLEKWIEDVKKHLAGESIPQLCIVGTKIDLEENRKVFYEEAKVYAESLGIQYIEVSAKNNQNVEKVFMNITKMILDQEQIK